MPTGEGDSRFFRVLSRTWILLVVLAVVVIGGFVVCRVHGYFGSEKRESYADSNLQNPKPFNPKRIVYEVFGPPGTVADISYFDVNGDPKRVDRAQLPWSLHITTTLPQSWETLWRKAIAVASVAGSRWTTWSRPSECPTRSTHTPSAW